MNIIICLDDRNGIQFNKRRLSKDVTVCDRILDMSKDTTLRMNEYSAEMFDSDRIKVNNNFLDLADEGDYCFSENNDFLNYSDSIEKVIIYRWNRLYPSDIKMDTIFLKNMKLISKTDFKGRSHEKITEEIYE